MVSFKMKKGVAVAALLATTMMSGAAMAQTDLGNTVIQSTGTGTITTPGAVDRTVVQPLQNATIPSSGTGTIATPGPVDSIQRQTVVPQVQNVEPVQLDLSTVTRGTPCGPGTGTSCASTAADLQNVRPYFGTATPPPPQPVALTPPPAPQPVAYTPPPAPQPIAYTPPPAPQPVAYIPPPPPPPPAAVTPIPAAGFGGIGVPGIVAAGIGALAIGGIIVAISDDDDDDNNATNGTR